jgi:hypothetical protein
MKSKILIIIALSAFALKANAQTEKGQNVIGLSGYYTTSEANTTTTYDKRSETKLSLNYAHFIKRNLALGLSISHNSQKSFVQSDYLFDLGTFYALGRAYSDTKTHFVTIGPYLRQYIDVSSKFKLYAELTASYSFGWQRNDYVSPSRMINAGDYTSYNAAINTGVAFYPTKKISIDLGFNLASYANSKVNYKNVSNAREEKFDSGLKSFKPMLGVNFHF